MLKPILYKDKIVVVITNAVELSELPILHEQYYNREGIVILAGDINMSGVYYTPPGTLEKPFKWVFDGGMNKITNLNIQVYNRHFGGLLGYARCTVRNLQLENVSVEARSYAGSLIGFADNCRIQNVVVSKINISGRLFVGGLTGGALQTMVRYGKLDLSESVIYSTSNKEAMLISQVGPGCVVSDVELTISSFQKLTLFSNVINSATRPVFKNIIVHQREVGIA
ncbi:MAG: hypothetical protein QXE80_03580 [Pyrobaculum sp.]